jgi:hypothetical protein
MEQAAKKLIKERSELRAERDKVNRRIDERIKAIDTALEIIELRLAADPKFVALEENLQGDVFREMTLPDGCTMIFQMYDGWLDKNQIEYLLTIGGYRFDAKDPTNSVDVTLRRMAAENDCEVEKRGGYYGNRYRQLQTKPEVKAET